MAGLGNPVQSIRLPSGRGVSRDRRLTPGEEEILLEACEEYGGDLPHVVRFALETAMRRGEIAGMTWDDVNFKKKTITLPDTKNGERRVVSLSSDAIGILSTIPRRIDGRVFGYTDPHSITWAFIHACKRAGIEDLTFHAIPIPNQDPWDPFRRPPPPFSFSLPRSVESSSLRLSDPPLDFFPNRPFFLLFFFVQDLEVQGVHLLVFPDRGEKGLDLLQPTVEYEYFPGAKFAPGMFVEKFPADIEILVPVFRNQRDEFRLIGEKIFREVDHLVRGSQFDPLILDHLVHLVLGQYDPGSVPVTG